MLPLAHYMFSFSPHSLQGLPATVHSGVSLRYQTYPKLLTDKTFKDNDQDKLIAGMEKACHLMAFCYFTGSI